LFCVRGDREFAVNESDIPLPNAAALEPAGEMGEDFGPAGQKNDPACLPVEPVDRMNPELRIAPGASQEIGIGPDPGMEKRAEVASCLLLDAYAGGLLHHEPTPARIDDQD
jgi:hypothetical protein